MADTTIILNSETNLPDSKETASPMAEVERRAHWAAFAAASIQGDRSIDGQSARHKAYAIPEITDSQLAERAAMVTLLHERETFEAITETRFLVKPAGLWEIAPPKNMRGASFIWSPEFVREVQPSDYVAAKKVRTLHTYGYYGMFKPSLAEVLAQAPDDLHEYAALSIVGPETAEDLSREKAALDAGFHVAEVTYYRRA